MIYLKLFWEFLKIGLFTFGGGYAMLPLIEETVLANGWLSKQQLVDFIAVSESTPGPFAVNISTYIGERMGGIPGALCATAGVVLPSFLIILIVARCYEKFKKSKIVNGCLSGLRPAVVALIGSAALSVGSSVFDLNVILSAENFVFAGIIIIAGIMAYKKLHPILIIGVSGFIGIAAGYGLAWWKGC